MEIVLVWLSTIIASFGMQTVYELRLFKDIADSGFKIDLDKINNSNKIDGNYVKKSSISNFIPIYNILMVLFKAATYDKEHVFKIFDASDTLIPLTEEEYHEYQLKPTGLHSFMLSIKDNAKNAYCLTTYEGNESGNIYFKLNDDSIEIEIIKLTGVAKHFTVERQNAEVVRHLMIHKMIGDEKFSNYDIDSFCTKYSDNDIVVEEEYSKENIKQELEAFRKLFEPEEKDNTKGYQYTKKK